MFVALGQFSTDSTQVFFFFKSIIFETGPDVGGLPFSVGSHEYDVSQTISRDSFWKNATTDIFLDFRTKLI